MTQSPAKPSLEFVLLMASIMSMAAMSIDAMLPALGTIASDLGAKAANQSQLIIGALFAGMAIGQLIAGPVSDAYGRRPLLFSCMGIYLVGCVICLMATSMNTMLFGRFVQGLGAAGPVISTMSIIRDRVQGAQMAKVMSMVMMIFIMAPVLAPAIGQTIIKFANWQAIFVFFLFYAIAVSTWVFIRLPETLDKSSRTPFRISTILSAAKAVFTNRSTLCYSIAMGCVFGAFIGYLSSIQQIFQDQFKVGDMFVVYFGLQALGFGVSSLINSRLVERLGMLFMVRSGLFAVIIVGIIMCAVVLFATVPFAAFFTFGLVSLFCIGLLFGNLNALAMQPMGAIAGTASAIIGAIGNFISIPLGTMIGQFYNGTLMPVSLGFIFAGAMALLLVRIAQTRS